MGTDIKIPEKLFYKDEKGNEKTLNIADVVLGHFKDHKREYRIAISRPQGLTWHSKKVIVYNPESLKTFFGGPYHAICDSVLQDENEVYIAALDDKGKSRVKVIGKDGNLVLTEPEDIWEWRLNERKELGRSASDFLRFSCNLDYFYGLHMYKEYGFSFSHHGLE